MSKDCSHFYEFAGYRLYVEERQLRRTETGAVVALEPKTFDVLVALVENGGRVVRKEQLLEAVWAETFVEEGNLTENVSKLRRALGDDARSPSFVETVPKVGYRFVADVSEVREDGEELQVLESTRERLVMEVGDHELEHGRHASAARWLALAAVGICLVAAAAAYAWWPRASGPGEPQKQTIAVLPFEPLVAEGRDQALELGMTDALIARLSRVRRIAVCPTSMVMKYAGSATDAVSAGRELGADVVLEGRLQRADGRIRLSVQLVRASDGVTMWAESFDERFTDVFAVQDSVSQRVASALALRLSGDEERGLVKRDTADPEAYDLYLQGRYRQNKMSPDDVLASVSFFNAALARDPNYALAYAGLADSFSIMGLIGPIAPVEAMPKARIAAEKALSIDSSLAEAHIALASVMIFNEWDWVGAEREVALAEELDPSLSDVHTFRAHCRAVAGRTAESVDEFRRARELAPRLPIVGNAASEGLSVPRIFDSDVLDGLFVAREYDEAIAEAQRLIERDPGNTFAYAVLSRSLMQKGDYDSALATCERGIAISARSSSLPSASLLVTLGNIRAVTGARAQALEIIERMRTSSSQGKAFNMAQVYAGLGDRDRAFKWLETAYSERYAVMWRLKLLPQFDGLRTDPRYGDLLRRMNLTP